MTTTNQNQYFDLHTSGIGYINRFREVPTRKGSFCSVTIGFLRGSADEVEYTYVDTIIRNKEVKLLLESYSQYINHKDSKVLATVTVGDIYADVYTKRDGATGAGIKGRLIGLTSLKINGQTVYQKDNSEAPVVEAAAEEQVLVVKLDPQDPDFKAKKADLQADGYRWNNELKSWVLAA